MVRKQVNSSNNKSYKTIAITTVITLAIGTIYTLFVKEPIDKYKELKEHDKEYMEQRILEKVDKKLNEAIGMQSDVQSNLNHYKELHEKDHVLIGLTIQQLQRDIETLYKIKQNRQ